MANVNFVGFSWDYKRASCGKINLYVISKDRPECRDLFGSMNRDSILFEFKFQTFIYLYKMLRN